MVGQSCSARFYLPVGSRARAFGEIRQILASLTKFWFLVEIAIMESGDLPTTITEPGQIRATLMAGLMTTETLGRVVLEGLDATKHITHNGNLIEVPDHATRYKFAEFVTNHIDGMPVKRQEIVTKQMTDVTGLKDKLKSSPALVKSMRRVLKEMDSDSGVVDADTEAD